MIDRKQMQQFTALNLSPINKKAMELLRKVGRVSSPQTGLAVTHLMLWGLENGLRVRGLDDPEMLILNLAPNRVMKLLTETDSGDTLNLTLPNDPEEAASLLLEELMASLRAQPA